MILLHVKEINKSVKRREVDESFSLDNLLEKERRESSLGLLLVLSDDDDE